MKTRSLSFYKKKSNKNKDNFDNIINNCKDKIISSCNKNNLNNNNNINNINNNIGNINNNINNNNNNNNLNDLNNYEQFIKLFKNKGFKNVSIVEFESENYIGFELKPNEIYQIEQILNNGGRSINIFVGGQRFFINSSSEHFIKASNEDGGVVIHKTKSKYFIAIHDLFNATYYDIENNFSNILDSIIEYNKDDFISYLI